MVWSRIDPRDGKQRFIRREGDNVILTRDKRGNLLNDIPDGWDVIVRNNRLKLVRGR